MKQAVIALLFIIGIPVSGVSTLFSEHNSEEQFKNGKTENVLIHSDGRLSLSRKSDTISVPGDNDWVINDLVSDDAGAIYAVTSGKGQVYKIDPDNKVTSLWPDNNTSRHVFSVAITPEHELLAGTGGEKGSLFIYNGKKFRELWSDPEVKFIWDMIVSRTGRIYLATGPNGQIWSLDSNGSSAKLVFDAPVANIITLALSEDGILYSGGDEYGLVYQTDLTTGQTTVAYDTGKGEVSSLTLDDAGNLYIATADSKLARPGSMILLSDSNNSGKPKPSTEKPEEKLSEKQDSPTLPPATRTQPEPGSSRQADTEGNLVLKLTSAGFIEPVFSGQIIIHDMILNQQQSKLLLATGPEGYLIEIDLLTGKSVIVFDSESRQLSSIILSKDKLYVGGADSASLSIIEPELVEKGEFVSDVFDAGQPSAWGTMYIQGKWLQDNVSVFARSGNTKDPDKGPWSKWAPAKPELPGVKTILPVGRFMQYKLALTAGPEQQSPEISEVKVSYSLPNLRPQIEELTIQKPQGKPQEQPLEESKKIKIIWQAEDANKDKLVYDVLIKRNDSEKWVNLADNIQESTYTWDTNLAPDGYYSLKVVASDEMANPMDLFLTGEKVIDYTLVDNTPPVVNSCDLIAENDSFKVTIKVTDAICVIKSVEYSLNCDTTLRNAAATDGIIDSNQEQFSFKVNPQESGLHIITIIATDIAGNKRIISQEFTR